MPRPNVVVAPVREIGGERLTDLVTGLATGAPREAARHLRVTVGGVVGLLDMSSRRSAIWREVLESLKGMGRPAYVEVDPDSGVITDVLQPIPFTVAGVVEDDEGLVVDLEISHAAHRLLRTNPHYDEIAAELRTAFESGMPVLVTESVDTDEIVDVRAESLAQGE